MNINNKQTNKQTKGYLEHSLRLEQSLVENPVENFTPPSRQLQGLSLPVAECYGKPHVGAWYTRDDVDSYAHSGDCPFCGRPSTNAHHCPPKGKSRSFLLLTEKGRHVLKPALFGLCGSGTTGCHGKIHGKLLSIRWEWGSPAAAEAWWSGEILAHHEPHSPELYMFGWWVLSDGKGEWTVRK